ncbi:MAG: hypothetical protein ABIK28_03905 [Planctomycetota bacterium]
MEPKIESTRTLKTFCHRIMSLFQPRTQAALDGVLSIDAFQKALHKQMCRSDRSGRNLCVIAFDALKSDTEERAFEHLVGLLDQRKRCFDEIGWFERHRIGIILPDTEIEGGHRLAESVFLQMDSYTPDELDYRVYAYHPQKDMDATYGDHPAPQRKLVSTGTRRDQI